jgi:protein pelota
MKLLKKDLKEKIIKVKVTEPEDLWFLHRLIKKGDYVRATTTRKIKLGKDNVRKKINVTVEVDKNHFENKSLRVSGKIIECNDEDIPIGNYQSIPIEVGDIIEIQKKELLKTELEGIKEAGTKPYKILICIFDREEALFYSITKTGYELLSKIKGNVRKKDYSNTVKGNFFKEIAKQIETYDERNNFDSIILASQGFWKDYLVKEISEKIKKKSIISSCSSVDETAIREILKRPETQTALEKTRTKIEEEIVEEVIKRIGDNNKVAYGLQEVKKAIDYGAVDKLIISSKMLETKEETAEDLTRKAEKQDGKVIVVNSEFEPGKEIDGLGGVAALLRFNITPE